MKILVLNYEFPPVGGGGGQACADLCRGLAERGHQMIVITTLAPGLPRREDLGSCQVQRVFTGRRSLFRASFAAMAGYVIGAFLPGLGQVLRWRPDLIHAHFAVPTGALALALSSLTGTPYVVTAHLGDVPGGVPEKTDRWFRRVYPLTPRIWRRAAAVVAVSEYTRQLAQRHYPVRIDVIPNGIPLEERSTDVEGLHQPPRMIFVGRFQPQKNLPFLVDLLARVKDLPWTMVFAGDGPQRAEVEARLQGYGLTERVHMLGWVSREEVDRQMRASDVLLMPSRAEGLPVVGLQALACGLALVVSRVGGLSELVEEGVNGRSCLAGEMACFDQALRWCLGDTERLRAMKAASRRRAARYDIRQVAEAYEAVFRRIVK